MRKIILVSLAFLLMGCNSENEGVVVLTGTVVGTTSCAGGPEPVFVIKLSDNDSIMTATLPEKFQVPDIKIQFKTEKCSNYLYCTTDKVYPECLNVYDVTPI